jgi:integrase
MKSRRRGQNEGSIFERKDGRWVGQLNLGRENGKRKRRYVYGQTAEEVRKTLNQLKVDHDKGLPVGRTDAPRTVGAYLTYWLENRLRVRARPRSYESFEILIRRHIAPALGKIPLRDLQPSAIQKFLNEKSNAGLSAQTVCHLRTVLRSALNQALKENAIARNPAMLVDPPRIPDREIHPLSPDDARQLLQAVEQDRLQAIYTVALSLGLRRGEVLGLKWSDINFEAKTLSVARSLQRISGKLTEVETKTKRSRRTLVMPEVVIASLRRHRARQAQERLVVGPDWSDADLVFTTELGTPIDPRNLLRSYKRILKNSNLPKARFHDLRHSAASLLLAQGVQLRTIMEILGHSSIALTANLYSHVLDNLKRDAAEKMDAIFAKNV